MNVVAMLNKPFDSENLGNCQVLNTATVRVNAESSVKGITTFGSMQIVDGEICVDGAAAIEVYSVDGMRIRNKGLHSGVYVIRIIDSLGNTELVKTFIK